MRSRRICRRRPSERRRRLPSENCWRDDWRRAARCRRPRRTPKAHRSSCAPPGPRRSRPCGSARRPDGNEIARRIDSMPRADCRHGGEPRREPGADRARVKKHAAPRASPSPNRARDHVSRRHLAARRVGHEALAGVVDEDGAFAAHRLGDERGRPRRRLQRGRMELHEFEVDERGAGARSERQTLSEASERVGADVDRARRRRPSPARRRPSQSPNSRSRSP